MSRALQEAIEVMPPLAATDAGASKAQKVALTGASSTAEQTLTGGYFTFYSTTDCHIAFYKVTGGGAATTNDWFIPAGQERQYFVEDYKFFKAIRDTADGTLWFYRSSR
jgi:hypothetical protein